MVREKWRRQQHARKLHDALLADRSEERATLLVLPDNGPAKAAYVSWGWHRIGTIKPFPDSPVYDSMTLELRAGIPGGPDRRGAHMPEDTTAPPELPTGNDHIDRSS